MASVKDYAKTLNISIDSLIKRLESVGINNKTADDILSDVEKKALSVSAVNGSKKLSLKRTTVTTLSQGKVGSKGVSVAVRKKKTFVKKTESNIEIDPEKLKKREALIEKRKAEENELKQLENARKQAHIKKKKQVELDLFEKQQRETEKQKQLQIEQSKKEIEAKQATKVADGINQKPSDKKKSKHKTNKTNFNRKELHVKKGSIKRRKNQPIKDEQKKVTVSSGSEHGFTLPTEPVNIEVKIPESITVGELAKRMSIKAADLLKVMMNNGIMSTINQTIDQDTAYLLVEEMGHTPIAITDTTLEDKIIKETSDANEYQLETRPPVVTIMGHVDHGKTSILDYIRKSTITKNEAGGITQHIGAYKVSTENGDITFLDTPGHAAFTAMRARGAKVTDIVVIVVSADDGVMPQTIEAIEHAKSAEVPIIIAMNKMDKPEADPDKIKNEMSKYEIIPEDWGGDTSFIPVSAHSGLGIDTLLETILLNTEILELKAPVKSKAKGSVVESRIDKGRGPVATIIVQSGTLQKGDIILSGREFGKIRGMMDDKGNNVTKAFPSDPVEILGLSGVPEAGSDVIVVDKDRQARELAEERITKYRNLKLAQQKQAGIDKMFSQMQEGELTEVNILVKSDVHGSAEAIRESLTKLSNEEVKVIVVSSGVGGINESDANLALASNAIILGFNVRADASAKKIINKENIDLHYFSIIYDLIDLVKNLILGKMKPEFKEQIVGLAEVRDVFKAPKIGAIAGCMVTEGTIRKNNPIRVLRDNIVIFEGELESLRRFKEDVNEVKSGTECGIGVKGYNDVKVKDQIEVFKKIEIKKTI